MFYDLGTLSFDDKLGRYVYFEDCSCAGDDDFLHVWMVEALSDPYKVPIPTLITEVRYAERKYDPKALEEKTVLVVIFGLSESTEYDQMRYPDRVRTH